MAELYTRDRGIGAGRAIAGVIGIFVSLGVGLGIMAFAAAFGLRGITQDASQAQVIAGSVLSLSVGLLPFVMILVLAVVGGVWAGNATREAGSGSLAGAVGSLAGGILLLLLVGIGFALGVAAAGVNVSQLVEGAPNLNIPATLQNQIQFLLSTGGLVYLLSVLVTSAIAGAVVGATRPEPAPEPRRESERRPTV